MPKTRAPVAFAYEAARLAETIALPWTRLELHEALRLLRAARAMDQQELSRRTDLCQSTLSRLETGRADPPWSTIIRVLGGLECAPLLLPAPRSPWLRRPAQWREIPDGLDP